MHDRQILDGVLIANERILSRHTDRDPGIICKVDLEKACDRVDWNFLDNMMRIIGFGSKWRGCIHKCVATSHFSILVSGDPKGSFQAQRGLRQRDLFSPLLFAIVGEALSCMVFVVGEANLITGFRLARRAPVSVITHLQFIGNTLLFGTSEENQVKNVIPCSDVKKRYWV